MAKAKTEKTIEVVTYGGHQSIYHRELYELGNVKIKLELNSEDFARQCYARAYALDGLEWKLIYSIPYPEMKTNRSIYYMPQYNNKKAVNAGIEFLSDVQRLKKYVREILS